MYKPPYLVWVLFYSFIFNSALLHAEETEHEDTLTTDSTLTLQGVVEKSLPNYPSSQLLKAKILQTQARQTLAKGFFPSAPSLTLRNQNDRLLSNRGETEWEAGVELPIWLSGQRTAREAIAVASAQSFGNDAQNIRLQLAGMVRDALWDIRLMEGLADIAKAKLESANQLERDVKMRVKLGDMAQKDLLVAQTETLQAETEKINADAEVQHAKFRYINLTGLSRIPAQFSEIKSVKHILDETHPALLNANGKIAISAEQRNLTKIELRDNPILTLGMRTIRGGFDTKYNDSIGVTIRIPFSTETRNSPLIAAAEMQYTEQQVELSQLKLLLAAAMHEAEHNLEVGILQLDVLTKQNAIAQQSLHITRKAFQLGELDLNDLMRVQAQAFNAERSLKNQQIQQLWNTARYNQAVGELP
jgi:outer membrane protein, heavy metal efflux system